MEIKNGKKPISAKPKSQSLTLDDLFGNTLSVSPEVAKAIESKGMAYRWISYTKFIQMGGQHERAWRPIKRKDCGMMDSSPENDPDGFIRRGDLVLAVRPKELHEKHRAYLRQEAQRGKTVQKSHADELRKYAKDQGIDMKISEGYGEED